MRLSTRAFAAFAVLLILAVPGFARSPKKARKPVLKQGYVVDRYGERLITYEQVGAYAIAEGDIIVNPASTLDHADGVAVRRMLWPGGVIPFAFSSGFSNVANAQAAMAAWTAAVPLLRFVPRAGHRDYLNFVNHPQANGGSSSVGRISGKQDILIGFTASVRLVMHELGHVAGLEHEHNSPERDLFIQINTANIQPGKEHNFEKLSTNGAVLRPYDYVSLMHYTATAFAKPDTVTMTRRDGGTALGGSTAPTAHDIASIRALYGPFAFVPHATGGFALDLKHCHHAAPGMPGFFPGEAIFCEAFTNAWLWSHIGPSDPAIRGLDYRCNEIYDPDDRVFSTKKHFICMPASTPYIWRWSDKGPIAGMQCVLFYHREGGAPWTDNYFCYFGAP